MTAETARYEDTNQAGQDRDRGVTRQNSYQMGTDPRDLGIPDIAAGGQSALTARHAATEKAESSLTSSSGSGSAWP